MLETFQTKVPKATMWMRILLKKATQQDKDLDLVVSIKWMGQAYMTIIPIIVSVK